MGTVFSPNEILELRSPHAAGTIYEVSMINFRGYTTNRSEAGTAKAIVSPVEPGVDFEVEVEWLSRPGE